MAPLPGAMPGALEELAASKLTPAVPPVMMRRGVMAALAAILLALLLNTASPSPSNNISSAMINSPGLLIPRSSMGHGGYLELEKPCDGMLPRIRLVGGKIYDEFALERTQTFFNRVLKLGRPFTVLWDPRPVRWPKISRKQLRMIRSWVDQNAIKWDTRVQAHAMILTNPVVRSLAQLVIRLFAPPQPIKIVRSEEEAIEFARSCCKHPKSWVKDSYADRDQRFGLVSWSW